MFRNNRRKSAVGGAVVIGSALAVWFLAQIIWRDTNAPSPDIEAIDVVSVLAGADDGFERAWQVRPFEFPRDHGPHPRFRTEWWYVTGNLTSPEGPRFGFQLTFFRFALSASKSSRASHWATNQVYMGHFAVTDWERGRFSAFERFSRDSLGLAGAQAKPFKVWLEDWSLESTSETLFPLELKAARDDVELLLTIDAGKPLVLQGDRGLSQKSDQAGNASYYYSFPRNPARGHLHIGERSIEVSGETWIDREWSTSALDEAQTGWDWFSLQLSDRRELMFYRLRRHDASLDPHSGGIFVRADSTTLGLRSEDVEVIPLQYWKSSVSGARYPVKWSLKVPRLDLELVVSTAVPGQEHRGAFRYWEGSVVAEGRGGDTPLSAQGYVELTGYTP